MTRGRQVFLGVCLVALFAILFVLVGGLNSIELLPGKPLPNPFAEVNQAPVGTAPPGGSWGAEAVRTFIQVILILSVAVIVVFAIISPEYRRQLIVVALIIAVGLFVLSRFEPGETSLPPQEQGPMNLDFGEAPPQEPVSVEIPEVRAPNWGVILGAIGASLLVTGLALLFLRKVYPLIKARQEAKDILLDELGRRASEAAERIRAGDDPREAVLRCYKEMSEILSREERVPNFSYFTPREFAQRLRARGMEDNHVDRLTAIFEQVRYGGRRGRGFADEAVACLEAIQQAYAHGGSA
jgi:hypothetical protein